MDFRVFPLTIWTAAVKYKYQNLFCAACYCKKAFNHTAPQIKTQLSWSSRHRFPWRTHLFWKLLKATAELWNVCSRRRALRRLFCGAFPRWPSHRHSASAISARCYSSSIWQLAGLHYSSGKFWTGVKQLSKPDYKKKRKLYTFSNGSICRCFSANCEALAHPKKKDRVLILHLQSQTTTWHPAGRGEAG